MSGRTATEVAEVSPTTTVADALTAMAATGVAVVRAGDGRLAGTVTDGALRTAVLHGTAHRAPLSEVAWGAPVWVGPGERGRAADLAATQHLATIPVVAGDDVVGALDAGSLGLHPPATTAVILAGGRGSRLAPLTDTVPKPLLSVGGRTILERILVNLATAGITDVHLAVNYLAEVFEARLGDGSATGVALTYLHEEVPLDTAGALSLLPSPPEGPVLVLNADQISSLPFARLVEHHTRSSAAITVAAFDHHVTVPYGVLQLEGAAVAGIEEKPTMHLPCNAGIYVLDPAVLDLVPPGEPYQMPALISAAMGEGRAVGAFPLVERFIDIGTREELDKALVWFATGEET